MDLSFELIFYQELILNITLQRFNGSLFQEKGQYSGICAIGSMDGEISIWSTSRPTALATIYNVFNQTVQDISWYEFFHHRSNDVI